MGANGNTDIIGGEDVMARDRAMSQVAKLLTEKGNLKDILVEAQLRPKIRNHLWLRHWI